MSDKIILYGHTRLSGIYTISDQPILKFVGLDKKDNKIYYETTGVEMIEDENGSSIVECYMPRNPKDPAVYNHINSETFKSKSSAWVKRFKITRE